ncbi:MAG: pre-tRNA nuclear export protein, partial [Bogoriella megaspora]
MEAQVSQSDITASYHPEFHGFDKLQWQVEKAIEIAFNPSASQDLKAQAFDFLNRLREDPASWQVGLPLSLRTPRASEVVRHSSLELVINAIQTHRLDSQSLNFIKDTVIKYLQDNYTGSNGNATGDTPPIRNKISQVVTFLFVSLYAQEWTGFFDDIIALTSKDGDEMGSHSVGTEFYLRVLEFVHEEVADLMISRSDDEQRRCNELKDLIRARDAVKIASSWQTILSKWRQLDRGVTKSCLRNVSGWVSWIDISLVVNDSIINPLLEIAGQQESTATVVGMRIAAIDTFSEIVAKKMRPPDKVQLISVLNVRMIIQQLVASSALRDFRWTPKYDVDLAESVAKLVNITVQDIVKILESNDVQGDTRTKANEMLQVFVPHLLRFFSDEYDEICSTVIPSLTDLLTLFRKVVKSQGTLPADQSAMIDPIVRTIVAKMKYDETANWGEEDEQTDEAEFQELRKRLHVLQQTAATIDQNLCIDIFTSVVGDAFTRYREGDRNITWRDLDLALYEMFLFGELAVKNGGLYQKTKPSSLASERLVKMMSDMIESDLASYHHPAIQLQYMEICVRYCSFFEQHTNLIPRTLESFVNFIRSNHVKVRTRSWYLFHRYVRHLRAQLGDVSELIIQSIGDLLTIRAELPQESADDDMSSEENDQSADAIFS